MKVSKIVKATNCLNPDSYLQILENGCIFTTTSRVLKERLGKNVNLVTQKHHSVMVRNQTHGEQTR